MDVANDRRFSELVSESRVQQKRIDATLIQLRALEQEVKELIAQIKWQRYLGYDPTSVEFVRNLAPPDISNARPH
jgi:hypothetical protein